MPYYCATAAVVKWEKLSQMIKTPRLKTPNIKTLLFIPKSPIFDASKISHYMIYEISNNNRKLTVHMLCTHGRCVERAGL